MVVERVVVGAAGPDEGIRRVARSLLESGREVVYVGGQQTPGQLLGAAIAEDAIEIVVDADPDFVGRLITARDQAGVGDIAVRSIVLDQLDG